MKKVLRKFSSNTLYLRIAKIIFWYRNVIKYNLFLKRAKKNYRFSDDAYIDDFVTGIVIQPWVGTTAPWYSITLAFLLKLKKRKVVLIFDDVEFGSDKLFFKIQCYSIKGILKKLNKYFEVLNLSMVETDNNLVINENFITINAGLNSIHFCKGELNIHKRLKYEKIIYYQLKLLYLKVNKFLDTNRFDTLILHGGIYGSSGIFVHLAKSRNLRVSTIDSGVNTLILCTNGIASQLQDIPVVFNDLKDCSIDFICKIAAEELNKRICGKDKFSSQVVAAEFKEEKNIGILIPLNSVWDSAVLGLNTIFKSYEEWLTSTIDWLLDNTEEDIVIRQHPHERFENVKSTDDYEGLVKVKYPNNSRVRFISCFDKINTYDLINKSKLIICFSSTIGIESVILRKPVIVVSNCYYSELGFVFKPNNLRNYFHLINSILSGDIGVSEDFIRNAMKCYYLTQVCNWLITDFTPTPSPKDFDVWVDMSLDDLLIRDDVSIIIESLVNNIPLCLLQHRKMLKSK